MSDRMSPVMDVEADLLGESPPGSPSAFVARRASQISDQQQQYNPPPAAGQTPPRAASHHSVNGDDDGDGGDHAYEPSPEDERQLINASHNDGNDDDDEDGAAAAPSRHTVTSKTNVTETNFASPGAGTAVNAPPHVHPHVSRQLASDAFESLNYDEIENVPLHEERAHRGGDLDPASWKVWIILALCGALTGLVAFGIDRGQGALSKLKFEAVEYFLKSPNNTAATGTGTNSSGGNGSSYVFSPRDFTTATTNAASVDGIVINNGNSSGLPMFGENMYNTDARSLALAFVLFLVINLAYVSMAAAVVVFGEPVAKGSGIPEVKCYLNGVRIWRVVRLKTMLVKAVGIIFAVASGLPVGKEGPMIHSGSAIASGISTGKSSLLKWDTGFFREFRTDAYKRAFITAGAAAGVGAAFGAPVGGIIFAIEEVCSFWNLELTVMVFLCAAVSPWTLQLLMHPTGLETGHVNGLIDFGLVDGSYRYQDIPFVMLLGISCGGLGAIFIWINMHVTRWRKTGLDTKLKKFMEVLAIALAVSVVLICLVLYGYNCVTIEGANNNTKSKMKTYGCHDGYFNDMATYFFTNLEDSINLLIHEPRAIPLGTLAKQFFPYFVLTSITYGINVPSGLFLPSLALGSNFGHMFAQIVNLAVGNDKFLNPAHFALYGGTGLLAGNLRMTISVVAIVMEATGNATFFYPLAMITICAKFFGDLFNHGIFDEHIDLARIPLLVTKNPQPELAVMTAADIMNKHPVRLPPECTVRVLLHVLKHYPLHNVYMVVDEQTGVFRGMLLRRTALILVDKEAWKNKLTHEDFARTEKERKYVSVKKYGVLEQPESEDMDGVIGLLRYADCWPHVFHTSAPVPRLYRTFRELGLRHIIIVDDNHRPVGLIGRRQLCFLEVTKSSNEKTPVVSAAAADGKASDTSMQDAPVNYGATSSSPHFVTTGALHQLPREALDDYDQQQQLLPLRDRDVRRSRLSNAPWIDTSLPESHTPIK